MRKMRKPMSGYINLAIPALLVTLTVAFCLPVILPLNKVVIEDVYLEICSFIDLNLMHLSEGHRIPFWAFHFGGGYPFLKHPDNMSLSPLFYILMVPFGSAAGVKLFILFSYCVGVTGFYLFANRVLRLGQAGSAIGAMYFIFNSFMPYQINTGHIKDFSWFYLPLVTFCLYVSKEDRRFIFFGASLVTLVILNGFSLYLAPMVLLLFLLALLNDIPPHQDRFMGQKRLLCNLLLILAIAFLLGAVKIFPMLELFKVTMRAKGYADAARYSMTFGKMISAFFSRGPYAVGNEVAMGPNGLNMGSVMYFGLIPGFFFLLSCVFAFMKIWRYLLAMTLFILMGMAYNSPIDLFYMLWRLPLFGSMHEVARYFSFPAVFLASVIMGTFFTSGLFTRLKKHFKVLLCLLALVGAADMFVSNARYFEFTALNQADAPKMRANEGEFFNVRKEHLYRAQRQPFFDPVRKWPQKYYEELMAGIQYYLVRQNIGLIDWFCDIPLPSYAAAKYGVLIGYGEYWKDFRGDISERNGVLRLDGYKGECFFRDHAGNRVKSVKWNTDEIVIDIGQIYPDKLVVNQNYDRDWTADPGAIFDANGLLGIALDKPVNGHVTLNYRPKAFYAGLTVSLLTLIFCLACLLVRKARKDTAGGQRSSNNLR
ncbi:MAG: hypothetical protein ABH875_02080 [Candidatus Omnitrophota bacterium]